MSPNLLRGRSDSQLVASLLRCRGTHKDSTSTRRHFCRRCLNRYNKPPRFAQPFSDFVWNFFKYQTAQPRVSALGASSLLDCYSLDSRFVQLQPRNVRQSYVGSASDLHKHWTKRMPRTPQACYVQADFHSLPQLETSTPSFSTSTRHRV